MSYFDEDDERQAQSAAGGKAFAFLCVVGAIAALALSCWGVAKVVVL